MTKVLEKPVHAVLLRPTQLEELAAKGRLPKSVKEKVKLPKEKEVSNKPTGYSFVKGVGNFTKQNSLRVKLAVLHDQVPALPKEKQPPCDTCVAACCYAFIVEITEMEYESGLYEDMAIKITPEMQEQLKSSQLLRPMVLNAPYLLDKETKYVLEGAIGEPCPFLTEDAKCGIYDKRPFTCRIYTCVGDPRITDDIRSGKQPIQSVTEKILNDK